MIPSEQSISTLGFDSYELRAAPKNHVYGEIMDPSLNTELKHLQDPSINDVWHELEGNRCKSRPACEAKNYSFLSCPSKSGPELLFACDFRTEDLRKMRLGVPVHKLRQVPMPVQGDLTPGYDGSRTPSYIGSPTQDRTPPEQVRLVAGTPPTVPRLNLGIICVFAWSVIYM